jgi:hypothetical protein
MQDPNCLKGYIVNIEEECFWYIFWRAEIGQVVKFIYFKIVVLGTIVTCVLGIII